MLADAETRVGQLEAVLKIQRCIRGWHGRRATKLMSSERAILQMMANIKTGMDNIENEMCLTKLVLQDASGVLGRFGQPPT